MTKFSISWLVGAIIAIAFTQPALSAQNIADDYWGATPPTTPVTYTDVVGSPNLFDISSMDVSLSGDTLTVTINTNFSNPTYNAYYGDLFLSSVWTPDPTGTNYENDDASTGTLWTYGFALDGRNTTTGEIGDNGTGTLYQLVAPNNPDNETNADNAYLSDHFFEASNPNGYREGQEVVVKTAGNTAIDDPNKINEFYTGSGSITFVIDVANTALAAGNIALHWAMTCANDTIEGFVPAPIILLIMATGLFGVGISTAARKRKIA